MAYHAGYWNVLVKELLGLHAAKTDTLLMLQQILYPLFFRFIPVDF